MTEHGVLFPAGLLIFVDGGLRRFGTVKSAKGIPAFWRNLLHLSGMKMEAAGSFETFVSAYQTIRYSQSTFSPP
jgi:hypothetical protein